MNKKDIIIAAMLINSVLLLGVFAFSKKNPAKSAQLAFPKVATTIAIPTQNQIPSAPAKPKAPAKKAASVPAKKKNSAVKSKTPAKKTVPIPTPKKVEKKTLPTKAMPAQAKKEGKSKAATPVYYTVQPGDNPWVIARKNHIKVDDLLKLNNLNKQSSKKIRPGDKLRIK